MLVRTIEHLESDFNGAQPIGVEPYDSTLEGDEVADPYLADELRNLHEDILGRFVEHVRPSRLHGIGSILFGGIPMHTSNSNVGATLGLISPDQNLHYPNGEGIIVASPEAMREFTDSEFAGGSEILLDGVSVAVKRLGRNNVPLDELAHPPRQANHWVRERMLETLPDFQPNPKAQSHIERVHTGLPVGRFVLNLANGQIA